MSPKEDEDIVFPRYPVCFFYFIFGTWHPTYQKGTFPIFLEYSYSNRLSHTDSLMTQVLFITKHALLLTQVPLKNIDFFFKKWSVNLHLQMSIQFSFSSQYHEYTVNNCTCFPFFYNFIHISCTGHIIHNENEQVINS